MIDINRWGKFKIETLFGSLLSKDDIQPKNIIEGDIPLISSGNTNNGIIANIKHDTATLQKANTITVDMFGKAFYQNNPYYCVSHGRVNILIPKFIINEYIGLFVVSAIEKTSRVKYSFSNMCTGTKLLKDTIYLPTTPDGQPDWDYMESYMKQIMEESEKSIENLNRVENKKDSIDISNWGEFCVGKLFNCETTLGIPSKNNLKEGNINYITRSAIDNGFSGTCGNEEHRNKGNCITIGAEGFVAFWQNDDFVAGNKVYALRHPKMNETNGLFICSALNALSSRYSFSDARILDKIKLEKIKLPATPYGQPDWLYMENYMKHIMDESEKVVSNLKSIA